MTVTRRARRVRNLDPVERWQCEDMGSIEGDSCKAEYSAPACVYESVISISSVSGRAKIVDLCIHFICAVCRVDASSAEFDPPSWGSSCSSLVPPRLLCGVKHRHSTEVD